MPIVEIGKIQVRRGKANTDTGLPQLSSGELCWAIDNQELFIGNGSVFEGSPCVGNTRILTERDLNGFESLRSRSTQLSVATDELIIKLPLVRSFDGSLTNLVTYILPYQCVSVLQNFSIQGEFNIYTDLNSETIELTNNYQPGAVDPIGDGNLIFESIYLDQDGQEYLGTLGQIISGIGIRYSTDSLPSLDALLTYYVKSDTQNSNLILNNFGYNFGVNYRQSPDGWLINFGNTNSFSIDPNTPVLVSITFQKPFISIPYKYSAIPINVSGDNYFSVAINSITINSMILRCYSTSLTSETMAVNWSAEGI